MLLDFEHLYVLGHQLLDLFINVVMGLYCVILAKLELHFPEFSSQHGSRGLVAGEICGRLMMLRKQKGKIQHHFMIKALRKLGIEGKKKRSRREVAAVFTLCMGGSIHGLSAGLPCKKLACSTFSSHPILSFPRKQCLVLA
jgi:hypothetical protein